jgi:hypothetical protein
VTTEVLHGPAGSRSPRHGRAERYRRILTVPGKQDGGGTYSTPFDVMTIEGDRYVVAGYGEVSWVKDARAAGNVQLTRGNRSEAVPPRELRPVHSVRLLRTY